MGEKGVGDFILKKLSELLILPQNFVAYVVGKVNEAFPPETGWGEKGVGDFILTKFSELPILLKNFVGYVVEKVNEAFPPETRSEQLKRWLSEAAPWALGLVLLLLFFNCCPGCGKPGPKTMKAPGRNYRMPRQRFEANPRAYFRDLRGKSQS